jgi:hypothetical protein
MYVCHIKARSQYRCFCGQAINIAYFCVVCGREGGLRFRECVRMCLFVCGLWTLVCTCVRVAFANPPCKVPPCCHLQPVRFHKIFRPYLINGTIFEEKVTIHKTCTLIFSTIFILKISHSKNNSARYFHKCENVFLQSTRYACRILMKLEFSRHIFEKSLCMKFNQNPSSETLVVPCGQTDKETDGHDETNSRFSQFC